jgi:outer membrane protein assembly factor BamD
MFVLETNRQRHRLGREGAALVGGLQLDADGLARAQAARCTGRHRTIDLHAATLDQALQVAARELAAVRDEQLVEALAVARGTDCEAPRLQRRFGRLLALERRVRVPIIRLDFLFPRTRRSRAGPPMIRSLALPLLLAAAMLGATGCGSTSKEDPNSTAAVEKLYAEAKDEMANGGWDRATKILERVEGRAAGTLLAQQAAIDLAYAQYRGNERAAALATIDRFIKLNPSSPAFDYALYLRGIINFNDNLGVLSFLSRQDLSERDQQASRESFQSFKQLVDQFPQSRYAGDARLRMDYIVNALAEYEVHVARYYYRRGAYVAAVNRAQQALTEFQQSPAGEEALFILMQSYQQLGLEPLRADAERVLKQNFPNSPYLRGGTRQREKAWWQLW